MRLAFGNDRAIGEVKAKRIERVDGTDVGHLLFVGFFAFHAALLPRRWRWHMPSHRHSLQEKRGRGPFVTRLYWRWKSRSNPGRPPIAPKLIALIKRMAKENFTWGAPRIQAELHLLGHDIAEATLAKYMPRHSKPPSQTWKTFLYNHVRTLASIDFFVVPTATFHLLFGFIVFGHDRRRVLHYNVTTNPSAQWVAVQLKQAFPFETTPRYLIRDRDGIYGLAVKRCLEQLGIEEAVTAPRSPWQNPYVERLIGTLRRELLDHVIVLNERHLMKHLKSYFEYYLGTRCHQSLDGNAPDPRLVEPPEKGPVKSVPMVGGLHHRYHRAA